MLPLRHEQSITCIDVGRFIFYNEQRLGTAFVSSAIASTNHASYTSQLICSTQVINQDDVCTHNMHSFTFGPLQIFPIFLTLIPFSGGDLFVARLTIG